MNSSVMPDKIRGDSSFPDHKYATRLISFSSSSVSRSTLSACICRTIASLRLLNQSPKNFMLGVGFKMSHTCHHFPFHYYDLYRARHDFFNVRTEELQFPKSAPNVARGTSADSRFKFMNDEGATVWTEQEQFRFDRGISQRAHHEIGNIFYTLKALIRSYFFLLPTAIGYAAMVTFVDKQVGRILDVVDELDMWKNLTIILTADHGMHNGEKGIWDKWTLFDESLHVPLMIYHPLSRFKGNRYSVPVESLDIFPTLLDILGVGGFNISEVYKNDRLYTRFDGKSLAPAIFGRQFDNHRRYNSATDEKEPPRLSVTTAISQLWKCAPKAEIVNEGNSRTLDVGWRSCKEGKPEPDVLANEVSVMGYSMRTSYFRYTAYVKTLRQPSPMKLLLNESFYAEELYDHRGEIPGDLGSLELVNLAFDPIYNRVIKEHRKILINFLMHDAKFEGNSYQTNSQHGADWLGNIL